MAPHPQTWKTVIAFAIIYVVWGCTFLAIRIGVHELPPLLFAAIRFSIAGAVLYLWTRGKGEPALTRRQWLATAVVALLIFLLDYGLLFWAEQRVPSGIAAVIMGTIPAFTALAEILFLRTQRLTVRLALALAVGLAGVAILMVPSISLGGPPIDRPGAAALMVAALCWSIASALSRKLPLHPSKVLSSGAQMLAGGLMLALASAALGELPRFHPLTVSLAAWLSLAFLIVAGSIVGFTAYVWLIHHQSPTKVATYAYVNPVIAVTVGHFIGGEALGLRTILGTLCVLVSVVVITATRGAKKLPSTPLETTAA